MRRRLSDPFLALGLTIVLTFLGAQVPLQARGDVRFGQLVDQTEMPAPPVPPPHGGDWFDFRVAAPSQRWFELARLTELYNERFKYPPEQRAPLRESFSRFQEELFRKWKSEGAMRQVLELRNDLKSSLVYDCHTLVDEEGAFLALTHEQSEYEDAEERSLLRVYHTTMLSQGVSFAGLKNLSAIRFKLTSLEAASGLLRMEYVVDLRKQLFGQVEIELRREGNQWSLVDREVQRPLRKIMIELWYSIFTMNGGVRKLHLDSRGR